jgi:predicted transcriptional regulator
MYRQATAILIALFLALVMMKSLFFTYSLYFHIKRINLTNNLEASQRQQVQNYFQQNVVMQKV